MQGEEEDGRGRREGVRRSGGREGGDAHGWPSSLVYKRPSRCPELPGRVLVSPAYSWRWAESPLRPFSASTTFCPSLHPHLPLSLPRLPFPCLKVSSEELRTRKHNESGGKMGVSAGKECTKAPCSHKSGVGSRYRHFASR
ncbi:hypothetical protein E2C01_093918 [Portunus trituberculatus]|uniref:Uncharacterized protein n=1 Tax=Portunus trituberculatus TaxID=210409 RepID=A0A5B7K1Q3_PORTR|nr:hypothetical protein [Portunus trituberculatus]